MEQDNSFFQLFVKLTDNRTLTLQFPISNHITAQSIKERLQSLIQIPIQSQKLTLNGKFLNGSTPISPSLSLSTIHLNVPLLGGKGGFGSLLRGAATKAGQKKTNNFDACRDMSGRRLRHVNAEKRLEEWKAEEEERRLEKKAEEYLKSLAKKAKKEGGRTDGAEQYVEKYRKESARCVEEVEKSVREFVEDLMVGKKRKLMEKMKEKAKADTDASKKMKIWMGKRKLAESDSDSSDDEGSKLEDMENEKSVVIDDGNQSDSSKEVEGNSGSVSVGKLNGGSYSSGSGSDEEREAITGGSINSNVCPSGSSSDVEGNSAIEPSSGCEEQKTKQGESLCFSAKEVIPDARKMEIKEQEPQVNSSEEAAVDSETKNISNSAEKEPQSAGVLPGGNELESEVQNGGIDVSRNSEMDLPLDFDAFTSATELEVLGMERLKSELQSRGLKCGGTLQERAARLFLLKTTPVDQLPKKLFAKK